MKQIFAERFGADPAFLQDIGMEAKGLEYSEYVSKESLAQQGGYGMALKGPQHDEAWLIFMDMVNKQIPTFEDKAEALHYFPMWRTWFGLNGPVQAALERRRARGQRRVRRAGQGARGTCRATASSSPGMTGREVKPEDLIFQSERVYNFQRIFNLKMGFGRRRHDAIPYRAQGPVTAAEYESRQERYDKQLKEEAGRRSRAAHARRAARGAARATARTATRSCSTRSTSGAAGRATASPRSPRCARSASTRSPGVVELLDGERRHGVSDDAHGERRPAPLRARGSRSRACCGRSPTRSRCGSSW